MKSIGVVCILTLLIAAIGAVRWRGRIGCNEENDNPCKDVTFGECRPNTLNSKVISINSLQSVQLCNEDCYNTAKCTNYRYNNRTKECTLITGEYRDSCDMIAGPVDKYPTDCLGQIRNPICDSHVEEDCEYNGELLQELPDGAIWGASECQKLCKSQAPDCKYWIHHEPALCILKKDGRKTCKVLGGPKAPAYDQCK